MPGSPPYLSDLLTRLPDRLPREVLFLHLGHFQAGDDIRAAQRRMNRLLIERAGIADGHRVLDVGCGIGGTLAAVDSDFDQMTLTGLNIGADQLAVAQNSVVPTGRNRIDWVVGDACALPFADGAFDRVLCIEAMFHFPSRARFLAEAARVLAPGGRLAGSDLWFAADADPDLVALVTGDLGPWPEPTTPDLVGLGAAVGLQLAVEVVDEAVAPTFAAMCTPEALDDPRVCDSPTDRGTAALGALHRRGQLHVVYWHTP